MPILCGSTAMVVTPGSAKSKGTGCFRNGITIPPNAASTWKKTSCAVGDLCEICNRVNHAILGGAGNPDKTIVFLSICSAARSASIRKSSPRGTVRISRPRISQAFLNEKWADSGTTIFGKPLFFLDFCEPECLDIGLGSPLVAYPLPPGSGRGCRTAG